MDQIPKEIRKLNKALEIVNAHLDEKMKADVERGT